MSVIGKAIRVVVVGFLCSAFVGCDETKEDRDARSVYWKADGLAARYVGKMTEDEVSVVRAKLSQTEFPAPQFTVPKMVPAELRPYGRTFVDRGRPDSVGRIGGNVMDYWLNERTVLRVGTVYYAKGEAHYEREEWFQMLTPKQAYSEEGKRWPYNDWKPRTAESAAK